MPVEQDDVLESILLSTRTIAVVGASPKPWRDSGSIARFLLENGYTVIPVNPNYREVLGLPCYADLQSVPGPIDMVDIFRNPDAVLPIIDQAIAVGAKTVWMQFGVVNEEAARRAEAAGLRVVMDRCIAVEFRRLMR